MVIVGGGISGLATADHLLAGSSERQRPRVTVLEASRRLGGVVRTVELAGRPVELGADSLVTRSGPAMELVEELGLGPRLIEPTAGESMVWVRGRLRPVPLGLTAGLPGGVMPLLRSGLLSPRAILRGSLDLVLPPTAIEEIGDSLGALIRARFGAEVLEHVADPVLGGINHGRCDELSLAVVAPHFIAALTDHRSLLRGLRAQGRRRTGTAGAPARRLGVVAAPAAGMQSLVDALAARVRERGGEIRCGAEAAALDHDGVSLASPTGEVVAADAVVVALPARPAARLFATGAPRAATALASLPPVSVAVVVTVHDGSVATALPSGNGILIPPTAGGLARSASWVSRKWSRRGGDGSTVIRYSLPLQAADRLGDDEALADALRHDVAGRIAGSSAPRSAPSGPRLGDLPPARQVLVMRHPDALSAQRPGHLGRVDSVLAALADELPNVTCAGPWLRGSSLAACIGQAHSVATRLRFSHG